MFLLLTKTTYRYFPNLFVIVFAAPTTTVSSTAPQRRRGRSSWTGSSTSPCIRYWWNLNMYFLKIIWEVQHAVKYNVWDVYCTYANTFFLSSILPTWLFQVIFKFNFMYNCIVKILSTFFLKKYFLVGNPFFPYRSCASPSSLPRLSSSAWWAFRGRGTQTGRRRRISRGKVSYFNYFSNYYRSRKKVSSWEDEWKWVFSAKKKKKDD